MTDKRSALTSFQDVQPGSRNWWTQNPMAYDWHGEIKAAPGTAEWFDAIDARFLYGARLFAHDSKPFDRLIPFDRLAGRRVLEIGCGMGLHTELLTRAGADVNAVDLSETSIEFTRKRLELKGLKADVRQCDAEHLPFGNDTFDFVWSWGVIHHSVRTGRIVREIARILKPGGEARVMVYNRDGAPAWMTLWLHYVLGLGFLARSFDEQLFRTTDGFMARYYTCDQFEDLFRTFFDEVKSQVFGQEADVVPLPRQIRRYALALFSEERLRKMQAVRGGFIFLTAQSKV
jgi:SAM-dependent methyltransferase